MNYKKGKNQQMDVLLHRIQNGGLSCARRRAMKQQG